MNKDAHYIDDLFRSALGAYEEAPSPRVKQALKAALDKNDAESYKRRFIGWKRTALLLLLLLTGFILYESGILKTGSGRTGKKVTGDDRTLTLPGQEEITDPTTTALSNGPDFKQGNTGNNNPAQEKNLEKEKSIPLKVAEEKEPSAIKSRPAKNVNILVSPNNDLQKEKTSIQRPEKTSIAKISGLSVSNLSQPQFISTSDALLKNNTAKNTTEIKLKFFTPFWMITAFWSYERAGYRLDSDLPTNITSIKHREIHEPSFSVGVLPTRQLTKNWGLQTGLIYSQSDIGISPQKLYALQNAGGDISFKYITSSGYAYIKPGLGSPPAIGDSLITKEGKHSLKFISVPLIAKYSVSKNKFTFSPGVGIEANMLTSAKVETEVESRSNPEIIFINKLDGAKRIYISVVADAELRYKLSTQLSLSFRPTISFAISPSAKNNEVETFPRSVGAGLGLTWKY